MCTMSSTGGLLVGKRVNDLLSKLGPFPTPISVVHVRNDLLRNRYEGGHLKEKNVFCKCSQ